MTERIAAIIEPDLLQWARHCLNLTQQQAAQACRVDLNQLISWETGTSQPSIPQLRELAHVYHVPIATFYLSEAPRGYTIMRDFRRISEAGSVPYSSELYLEVQNVQYRREIALDLYESLDYSIPTFSHHIEISEDYEAIGLDIRDMLGITRHEQVNLSDNHAAFRYWKNALETNGVFVFQSLNVSTEEMRGFSIGTLPMPCVAVNGNDYILARIFTLMHELVHVLLHVDGLCDFFDQSETEEKKQIEQFCNGVAGAVLLPARYIKMEDQMLYYKPGDEWSDKDIKELATKYKLSREVFVRRLLSCGLVTQRFYQKKREQYRKEPRAPKRKGFTTPAQDAIRGLGNPYIRLLFSAYNNGSITLSDMTDFLGARTKHFSRIEGEVFKRGIQRRH